jgi:hypothetical protein
MKSLLAVACVFVLSLSCSAQSKPDYKAIYAADTKKVESGDLAFDWKEFRLAAFQGGTEYFDWHPLRPKFSQAMEKGDYDAALKIANDIIHHNMADPEGHLLALAVDQKLGKQQEATFQHKVVDAYVKSILDSGDGRSAKTAFFVVQESEEYFYLNIILGVGLPELQSLVSQEGHSYDLLKVKDRDGKEQEIWFNVDTSMNAMAEAMSGGKKKK